MTIAYDTFPRIGDYDSHLGFNILAVVFGILIILCTLWLIDTIKEKTLFGLIPGFVILLSCWGIYIAGINSFGVGEKCTSEKVNVTLMDASFEAEYKTGKHSVATFSHVFYMTPDGPVSFRRTNGSTYPKEAILYKNSCETIKR